MDPSSTALDSQILTFTRLQGTAIPYVAGATIGGVWSRVEAHTKIRSIITARPVEFSFTHALGVFCARKIAPA
ncbi:hypothetical protein PM082_000041 [Marasmius tenuissimus]|nr:hypothetical protein PM082_000041 [Marasmius tenuissimus]